MLGNLFASGRSQAVSTIPLFPLRTVLFPGGLLPLKVFEQRYVEMTKRCMKEGVPFGVVMITSGEEVATQADAPAFANFGTLATSSFSSGEWTPVIVGPNDTMWMPGYFSPMMPHSRPAWTAFTAGALPNICR